tara:strand:- start:839 stop:1642 length:804 start_codon:yes stop_codon:yes gene_type:complete
MVEKKNTKTMVDAFNQTNVEQMFGGIDFMDCLKKEMEKINLDDIMKEIERIKQIETGMGKGMGIGNSVCFGNGMGLGNGIGLGNGMGFVRNSGYKCSPIKNTMCGMMAGGGMAIIPMVFSYFMMTSLVLMVGCCILIYLMYLKYNNNCCNHDCAFGLNKNILKQIKLDFISFIKNLGYCLLKKSVKIIKCFSKLVTICYHVYSKSVEEFINTVENTNIDFCCDLDDEEEEEEVGGGDEEEGGEEEEVDVDEEVDGDEEEEVVASDDK